MAETAPRKRQKLEPELDEVDLDSVDHPALKKILSVQEELEKVNDEASDRVLEVEQEYNKKRRPIYAKRNEYIKQIPGFWKKVLMSHAVLRRVFSEGDLDVLDYLTEVDIEDFPDIKSGFKISFKFEEGNPFFTNTQLDKQLHFADDASLEVKCSTIDWKEEARPGSSQAHHLGKRNQPDSSGTFYNFFEAWLTQAHNHPEPGVHDDVADILKEDIWPDPVKLYKGEIPEEDAYLDEDEYEEEGEDDEDDEDQGPDQYEQAPGLYQQGGHHSYAGGAEVNYDAGGNDEAGGGYPAGYAEDEDDNDEDENDDQGGEQDSLYDDDDDDQQ
eukprot:jgi/Chrzof1/6157/Cz17g13160.t1